MRITDAGELRVIHYNLYLNCIHAGWTEWSSEAVTATVGICWQSKVYDAKFNDPNKGKYLGQERDCISQNCTAIGWDPAAGDLGALVQQLKAYGL